MHLPHLHLYHPDFGIYPHLVEWLAEVEDLMSKEPDWDGCQRWRVPYNSHGGFDVPTAIGHVRSNQGPVVFIQKVQGGLLRKFRDSMQRSVSIYAIAATDSTDIWAACEDARLAYVDGEPRIPSRELIAFLIVMKLWRKDMWAGTALNKAFLNGEDLPNGGFPKEISAREIMEVANALINPNVLASKKSQGKTKYGLGDRVLVDRIVETKSLAHVDRLTNYLNRSPRLMSARLLDYNEG